MADLVAHDGFTFLSSEYRPSDGKHLHSIRAPDGSVIVGVCNAAADDDETRRLACAALAFALEQVERLGAQ